MTDILNRNPPYGNTAVPYERTKAAIELLLKSYGVKGIQWTSYQDVDDLKFIVEVSVHGVKKEIGIQVKPPQIKIRKRVAGRGLVFTENRNQEYRLLYHWIKSKLEAVVWGLSTVEKEFLSQVIVSLPTGQSSVGEVISSLIAEDRINSLPFLEGKKQSNEKVIDVEGKN